MINRIGNKMSLRKQILKFESNNWKINPAKQLEGTLFQLELIKNYKDINKKHKEKAEKLENSLRHYLVNFSKFQNILVNTLPMKLSRIFIQDIRKVYD